MTLKQLFTLGAIRGISLHFYNVSEFQIVKFNRISVCSLTENIVCYCFFMSPFVKLQIFVESLLGSEKKTNIELAGEFLAKTKQESTKVIKSPKRGDSVGSGPRQPTTTSTLFKLRLSRVTYENSVKLVLRAAKEYFDSSSKLVDPNMDLAR